MPTHIWSLLSFFLLQPYASSIETLENLTGVGQTKPGLLARYMKVSNIIFGLIICYCYMRKVINMNGVQLCEAPFSAFWLRSSVASVTCTLLIYYITYTYAYYFEILIIVYLFICLW